MRPMSTDTDEDGGPYAEAAALYFDAGWTAPLPLPPREKHDPPPGFTGRHDPPSRADVQAWIEGETGRGNIGLRMPEHVIGIDVDVYHGGGETFRAFGEAHGGLPYTWRSTSREDGSAIYFYRVPPHLGWRGQLGDGVELIQYRHRYAVVWPSVHPSGNTYRWYTPEGLASTAPPDPDTLPLLPQAWVDALKRGDDDTPIAKADLAPQAAVDWIKAAQSAETPCRRVVHALHAAIDDLRTGSAHESARAGTLRLTTLAAEHHAGVSVALTDLAKRFVAEVTNPARDRVRTDEEARGEWFGLVMGAVGIAAAKPANPAVVDPCDNPFGGIMPAGRTSLREIASVEYLSGRAPQPSAQLSNFTTVTAGLTVSAALTEDNPLAEVEHSTWAPIDLDAAWDGDDDDETETPSILRRADGAALFYRGQVNGLIGESESGKTWLAFEAVRQVLDDGGTVQLYDFEDSKGGAISRLKALSVSREMVRDGLKYINPDEPVMTAAAPQAWADLAANLDERPDLIVVDGYNAAMSSQGLSMDSNDDVTRFVQLLRKMAACGAAVVTVDHVPKNPDGRLKGGIGAQAKRSGMTGATVRVEVDGDAYPTPGKTGFLRLSVDKDRRGKVREAAAGGHLSMVSVQSDPITKAVVITLAAPDPNAPPPVAAVEGKFDHSLAEKITETMLRLRAPISYRKLGEQVKHNSKNRKTTFDWLVEHDYVADSGEKAGGYPLYVCRKGYDQEAEELAAHQRAILPPAPEQLDFDDEAADDDA